MNYTYTTYRHSSAAAVPLRSVHVVRLVRNTEIQFQRRNIVFRISRIGNSSRYKIRADTRLHAAYTLEGFCRFWQSGMREGKILIDFSILLFVISVLSPCRRWLPIVSLEA